MSSAPSGRAPEAQYRTESLDDVRELLDRAGNWAEWDCGEEIVAAELREAAAFVEELEGDR